MANSLGRGSCMDYSKFSHQRDFLPWGKKKPQKFSNIPRHPLGQNALFGIETDPSHFMKTGFISQQKQNIDRYDAASSFDVLSDSGYSDSFNNIPPSYSPFNSYFSENLCTTKPLSQLQSDYNGSSAPNMEYYEALVNKILEDTDGESVHTDSASQFSGHMWNNEIESIGELAIKLADLNMLENQTKVEPTLKSSIHHQAYHNGGNIHGNKLASANKPYNKEPLKVPKIDSPISMTNDRPAYPKRNIAKDFKKKKFTWNWHMHQNQSSFSRGMSANFEGNGLKPANKQGLRNFPPSPSPRQAPGVKNKHHDSSKYPGSAFWLHYGSNGSNKSDGSSSSNSSVYRDHNNNHTSDDSSHYKDMSKSNDFRRGQFTSSKQPRRIRKTYSSASSSSGGKSSECVFCKTNGETSAIYRGHVLKDDQGRTVCSVLQQYVCPLCRATGYEAHTIKYCPKNVNPPPIATMTTLKSMRSSTGRKRHGPCSGQIRPIPFGFRHSLLPA